MRRNMMNPMQLCRKNNTILLKHTNPPRQPKVRMTPLVNLICHCNEYGEEESKVDDPNVLDVEPRATHQLVVEVEEWQCGQHKVITVCLDKVVTGDGSGVNVVFAEWTDKRCAKDGEVDRAPSVGAPVDQSREGRETGLLTFA